MLVQSKLLAVLKVLKLNYDYKLYKHKCYINRIFICLNIAKRFRNQLNRRGGPMSRINGYKIHKVFLFLGGVMMKDQTDDKAKHVIRFVFDMHIKMRY